MLEEKLLVLNDLNLEGEGDIVKEIEDSDAQSLTSQDLLARM